MPTHRYRMYGITVGAVLPYAGGDARREGINMNAMAISGIVFACAFGGALLGMLLHYVLPPDHLSDASKGVLNLAIGIIGTMAALVVGLLIASAKGSFDK